MTAQTNPDELSHYMIGRALSGEMVLEGQPKDEDILYLEHISLEKRHRGKHLEPFDLHIRKGEILGIAGVEGNGRSYYRYSKTYRRENLAGRRRNQSSVNL